MIELTLPILYSPLADNLLCLSPKYWVNNCDEMFSVICKPPRSISHNSVPLDFAGKPAGSQIFPPRLDILSGRFRKVPLYNLPDVSFLFTLQGATKYRQYILQCVRNSVRLMKKRIENIWTWTSALSHSFSRIFAPHNGSETKFCVLNRDLSTIHVMHQKLFVAWLFRLLCEYSCTHGKRSYAWNKKPNKLAFLILQCLAKLQNTGPLSVIHQTSRLVWLACSFVIHCRAKRATIWPSKLALYCVVTPRLGYFL